jgi:hypothetical protein
MPTILTYGLSLILLLVFGFILDLYTRYRAGPKEAVVLRINYVLLFVAFNFGYAYWQYSDAKAAREELARAQDDLRQERTRLIACEKEMDDAVQELDAVVKKCFDRLERKKGGAAPPAADGLTGGSYEVILENADVPNPVATELMLSWPAEGGFKLAKESPQRVRFGNLSEQSARALAGKLRRAGGEVLIRGPADAP